MNTDKLPIDLYQIKINGINRDILENNRKIKLEKFNIYCDLRFIAIALILLVYLIFLAYVSFDLRAFFCCGFAFMVAGIILMSIFMAIYKINETKKLLKQLYEHNRLCLKLKFWYLKME